MGEVTDIVVAVLLLLLLLLLLLYQRAYHKNTLWGKRTTFTCSAITPPKEN